MKILQYDQKHHQSSYLISENVFSTPALKANNELRTSLYIMFIMIFIKFMIFAVT